MEMGPWNSHPLLVSCWAGCWYWPSKYSIQNLHVGVHWLSHLWLFAISLTAAHQAFLSFIISWSLLKLMSVESVMLSNHLFLCCPHFPPALNLSQHQGLFQMSQLFTSGGQSIGLSASASVLPMNIQDWFSLGWTGWISLQSNGLTRVFSNTTV